MTHALRAAAALALGLALVSGCGDSEPTPPPSETAGETPPAPAEPEEPTDPQIAVERGDAGTLPEEFPHELMPPGSSSSTWMSWGGASKMVIFGSELEPQAVFDHFANGLGPSGWEVTEAGEVEEGSWQVVATKDAALARISIIAGATGTEFAIALSEKP